MPVNKIGPKAFHPALATADFQFTPQEPYAAKVTRIAMTGVSASDTWVLTIDGREITRFYEATTGGQQLLGSSDANYPKTNNIFDYLQNVHNIDLSYPVPQGALFDLKSVGGATADIGIEYVEMFPQELSAGMVNHPQGNHFIIPVYAYLAAAVTAAGEYDFDTEIKPSWIPSFWMESPLVGGWTYRILGLFLQGKGRNTYSGSADHQSATDRLVLEYDGTRMFSRDSSGGIPMVGVPSAAGSANSTYGQRLGFYHSFQQEPAVAWEPFESPMLIRTGDKYEWLQGFTGSFTGGADYSDAVQVAILDITRA